MTSKSQLQEIKMSSRDEESKAQWNDDHMMNTTQVYDNNPNQDL